MIPQKYRAWVYRIATTAAALGVAYGLLSDEKAVLWLSLAGAVTNGLAAKNTPSREG